MNLHEKGCGIAGDGVLLSFLVLNCSYLDWKLIAIPFYNWLLCCTIHTKTPVFLLCTTESVNFASLTSSYLVSLIQSLLLLPFHLRAGPSLCSSQRSNTLYTEHARPEIYCNEWAASQSHLLLNCPQKQCILHQVQRSMGSHYIWHTVYINAV